MVLDFFTSKLAKKEEKASNPKTPVLSEEDEQFLHHLTSEETPPPLPARPIVILDDGTKVEGKDAQTALMAGADQIPLPRSPPAEDTPVDKLDKEGAEKKKKRASWNFIPSIQSRLKGKNKERAADDIKAAADALKTTEGVDIKPGVSPQDAKKEEADLTAILDQLNLAAVNNRVFSFTKESEELLDKFKQVLKDLINGVPTAYNDLEKLLTQSESQLSTLFAAMPPFLQSLVKSLPKKMTASLGPEFLAAASEKPGVGTSSASAAGIKSRIPSLKSLVSQQGAVVAMLRTILNFLKLRFPAFVSGTNVLLSLAIFLLLFVFWYCHKRGKETRLEKERLATDGGDLSVSDVSDIEDDATPGASKGPESKKSETAEAKEISNSSATSNEALRNLPSVQDLPDPVLTPLPETTLPKGGAGSGESRR